MKPPFVVVLDDRNILLYDNIITDLEPLDIDLCFAFDSDGKVLSLVPEKFSGERIFLGIRSQSSYEGVVLKEMLPIQEDVISLRKSLISCLVEYHTVPENELLALSISQLIEEIKEKKELSK